MDTTSIIPPRYDPFYGPERVPRRPSNLTLSSTISTISGEPSPTKSRVTEGTSPSYSFSGCVTQGPFTFVGPERRRFHAGRDKAPYPIPCGLEELSR